MYSSQVTDWKGFGFFVARRPGWIHGVGGLTLVPPSGKNSRLETNTDLMISYLQTSFVISNWSRCLEVLKWFFFFLFFPLLAAVTSTASFVVFSSVSKKWKSWLESLMACRVIKNDELSTGQNSPRGCYYHSCPPSSTTVSLSLLSKSLRGGLSWLEQADGWVEQSFALNKKQRCLCDVPLTDRRPRDDNLKLCLLSKTVSSAINDMDTFN